MISLEQFPPFLFTFSRIFFLLLLCPAIFYTVLPGFHPQGDPVPRIDPTFSSFSDFRFVDSSIFRGLVRVPPPQLLVSLYPSPRISCQPPQHNHHSRNPTVCPLSHTPSSGLTLFPPRFHCVRSLSSLNNPQGNS